MKNLKTVKNI